MWKSERGRISRTLDILLISIPHATQAPLSLIESRQDYSNHRFIQVRQVHNHVNQSINQQSRCNNNNCWNHRYLEEFPY